MAFYDEKTFSCTFFPLCLNDKFARGGTYQLVTCHFSLSPLAPVLACAYVSVGFCRIFSVLTGASDFPDGEMITKLFPLLVANPLCVDMDGAPISYESYEFSPRQVSQNQGGW